MRSTACCGKEAAHDHRSRRPDPPLPPGPGGRAPRPAGQPPPGAPGRGRRAHRHRPGRRSTPRPRPVSAPCWNASATRPTSPPRPASASASRPRRPGRPPRGWRSSPWSLLVIPFLGWVVGVVLVWLSRRWTTRDKLDRHHRRDELGAGRAGDHHGLRRRRPRARAGRPVGRAGTRRRDRPRPDRAAPVRPAVRPARGRRHLPRVPAAGHTPPPSRRPWPRGSRGRRTGTARPRPGRPRCRGPGGRRRGGWSARRRRWP